MAKILFFQRTLAHYRHSLLEKLSEDNEVSISFSPPLPGEAIQPPNNSSSYKCLDSGVNYLLGKSFWFETKWLKSLKISNPSVVVVSPTFRCLSIPLIYLYCYLNKIPLVGWGMGPMPYSSRLHRVISTFSTSFLVRLLSGMIVYSSSAKKYYESLGAINVVIGYNTCVDKSDILDFDQLQNQPDDHFSIAYIGRITPAKKIEDLILAVKSLPTSDWRLEVYGGGNDTYLDYIKSKYLLDNRIKFNGPIYGPDKFFSLSHSHLTVLPGLGGLAIIDSLCASVPVLVCTTDGSETDNILEGVSGFYFDNNSSTNNLSNKLLRLYERKNILIRMRKYCYEFGQKRSTETLCSTFNDFIADLN